MSFSVTLINVAIMLLYAVPGYLFVKTKFIHEDATSAFAKLLMYVAQPFLTLYSFQKVTYSKALAQNMLIFFLLTLLLQAFILLLFRFIFKNRQNDVRYRISNLAMCFGNCGFMGIPLLEALLPDAPDALAYSTMFFLSMNMLGWTVGSAMITRDRKYISFKKVILNPAVIPLFIALPQFFLQISLPDAAVNMITVLGKMSTPLCMIVMGMRLATIKAKALFTDSLQYITIFVKQILMPLFAFAIIYFLPVDTVMKQTLFILSACPVASVVQNFAELLGEGQKTAANMVLLGTGLSVLTIPVMLLIL